MNTSAQTPTIEEKMADAVVAALKPVIGPLLARVAALEGKSAPVARADFEARLKALEDRPALAYGGVFEQGITYRAGTLVTRSGSLWLALRPLGPVARPTRQSMPQWGIERVPNRRTSGSARAGRADDRGLLVPAS